MRSRPSRFNLPVMCAVLLLPALTGCNALINSAGHGVRGGAAAQRSTSTSNACKGAPCQRGAGATLPQTIVPLVSQVANTVVRSSTATAD